MALLFREGLSNRKKPAIIKGILSHVQHQVIFERLLAHLQKLTCEPQGKKGDEENAGDPSLGDDISPFIPYSKAYDKKDHADDRFIKLGGMPWYIVNPHEDKSPRNIGRCADHFGVHEVPQSYETSGDGRGDHQPVHHPQVTLVIPAAIQVDRDQYANSTSMARETSQSHKLKLRFKPDGQDLDGMRPII
nr:hypothetical protein [Chryseosolibacter histidini]